MIYINTQVIRTCYIYHAFDLIVKGSSFAMSLKVGIALTGKSMIYKCKCDFKFMILMFLHDDTMFTEPNTIS